MRQETKQGSFNMHDEKLRDSTILLNSNFLTENENH